MPPSTLLWVAVGLAAVMFFTWALEVHRTLREIRVELRRIREALEEEDGRPPGPTP